MSIKDLLEYLGIVGGVIGSVSVFKEGYMGLLRWSRKSELAGLKKERDLLTRLLKSDGERLGWLLNNALIGLALFSAGSMFKILELSPDMNPAIPAVLQWMIYASAYIVFVYTLGISNRLRKSGDEFDRIDARIIALEFKQARAAYRKGTA